MLQQGYAVADERGDNMPRDEMGKMLVQLGKPLPASRTPAAAGASDGFRCQRPGCMAGRYARRLPQPPKLSRMTRRSSPAESGASS